MPTTDPDYDDDFGTDDDGHDEQPPQGGGNNWRRKMERELKQLRESSASEKSRADKAERSLAFAKAGVPLDDPRTRYFVNGYDGDLTPEAIKAEAATLGLVEAPEPKADPIPQAEKDAHQRVSDATAGTTAAGERDWEAELLAAETPADVIRIHRERGGVVAPGV